MMQLLIWHVQISVLCMIGAKIMMTATKERLARFVRDSGCENPDKGQKEPFWRIFFCPVLNVIVLIEMIYLIIVNDEKANEISTVAEMRKLFKM